MKKILKLGLLIFVAFITTSTYATGSDFLLNVRNGEGKLIVFSINGVKKINVAIYDKGRDLIYSEVATGKEGIMRTYSLEEFPEGTYYLEVENNQKKMRYEIIIDSKLAEMSKRPITEVYKTSFENKGVKLASAN